MRREAGFAIGPILYAVAAVAGVLTILGGVVITNLRGTMDITVRTSENDLMIRTKRMLMVQGTLNAAGFMPLAATPLNAAGVDASRVPAGADLAVAALGGGGLVPATSGAPQTDARGRYYTYCPYPAASLAQAVLPRATIVLISAGADGVVQSACPASAASPVAALGDDLVTVVTVAEVVEHSSEWSRVPDATTGLAYNAIEFGGSLPSQNRVGIGTDNPQALLDVNGNGRFVTLDVTGATTLNTLSASGGIDNTVIGAATPAAGSFTGLTATGATVNGPLSVSGTTGVADGSAASPGLQFASDTGRDTGLYRPGEDQIGFAAGGAGRFTLSPGGAQFAVPMTLTGANGAAVGGNLTVGGNATLGDQATDAHTVNGSLTLNNSLAVKGNAALGDDAADAHALNGTLTALTGARILLDDSVAAAGAALPLAFDGDGGTGLFRPGAEQLGFVTGGASRVLLSAAGAQFTVPVTLTGTNGAAIGGGLTVAGNATLGDQAADAHTVNGSLTLASGPLAINGGNALTVSGNATLGDQATDAHTVNGSLTLNNGLSVAGSASFTLTPRVGTDVVWHSGNDGPGSGLSADLIDDIAVTATGALNNQVLAYDTASARWMPKAVSGVSGGATNVTVPIGAVTSGQWCRGDGTAVQCDRTVSGTTGYLAQWTSTGLGDTGIQLVGGEARFSNAGGTGGILTDYISYNSDSRLKTVTGPVEDALDRLARLDAVRFTWRNGDGRPHLGVLAQQVQAVFPELVREGENGFLRVDYPGLAVPLLAAVKDLRERSDRQFPLLLLTGVLAGAAGVLAGALLARRLLRTV